MRKIIYCALALMLSFPGLGFAMETIQHSPSRYIKTQIKGDGHYNTHLQTNHTQGWYGHTLKNVKLVVKDTRHRFVHMVYPLPFNVSTHGYLVVIVTKLGHGKWKISTQNYDDHNILTHSCSHSSRL